jgi:hypothetical protein
MDRYSNLRCGALQLLQGYLWFSLLPLINALFAWSVSFGGRPSLGRFVVVPYSFHLLIMDLMGLRGKFQIFFITRP